MKTQVATLALEISQSYVETDLIRQLKENDNEIIQDIGKQVLNDEGYPEWASLKDVDYTIHLISTYDAEDWAELATELFHIDNIKQFVEKGMYILFEEFIDFFNIDIEILTDKETVEQEQ